MESNYINIIRLLDHCNIDVEFHPIDTNRALKILKAEFASSPDGFIKVGEYDYTLQSVIEIFSNPNIDQILIWEKEIYENEYLIQFLELNFAKTNEIYNRSLSIYDIPIGWDAILYTIRHNIDDEFIAYYSKYFAVSINEFSKKSLTMSNHDRTTATLDLIPILLPEDIENATRAFRLYLWDAIKFIRNTNPDQLRNTLKNLQHFSKPGWAKYFNKLPVQMNEIKLEIVKSLIMLMSKSKSRFLPRQLVVIGDELNQLSDLRPDLKNVIDDIHETVSKFEYVRVKNRFFLFVLLTFIIFTLIRIFFDYIN